jgi:predicted transcriptional regulator
VADEIFMNGGDIHLHSDQQLSRYPYPKGKPPKLLQQSGGAAFRKTQTPSANSLTGRHSERKKNLSLNFKMRRFRMPILGERFYQMSNAIFCYDLKPIPLAVYSYLVCCAGQKDVCWPSMKTIALHCGCSENAARDAVSLLVDRGFIRKVKTSRCVKSGKWLQGNNHYYILPLPELPAADHSA